MDDGIIERLFDSANLMILSELKEITSPNCRIETLARGCCSNIVMSIATF